MRRRSGGFTLVEVIIALAIVAVVTVLLLERRVGIVEEAIQSRDIRTIWALAGEKMAALELDPDLWKGDGSSSSGDFGELDAAYERFVWEYVIEKHEVPTNDPSNLNEKPKEIYRLTLKVDGQGLTSPIVLEAEMPLQEAATAVSGAPGADGSPPPPSGQPPEGATTTPPPVPPGVRK